MKTETNVYKEHLHIKFEYIFKDLEHKSIRFTKKNTSEMQSYFQCLKKAMNLHMYHIAF